MSRDTAMFFYAVVLGQLSMWGFTHYEEALGGWLWFAGTMFLGVGAAALVVRFA